jgi:hypothetical protein
MITLASVAISVTIGLVALMTVHGQSNDTNQTSGTIKVEGRAIEEKNNKDSYSLYGTFDMSDNNKIRPSNQCKGIPVPTGCTNSPDTSMFVTVGETGMTFGACYILQDNITNGHLTPKQKKLVEDVHFLFMCSFDDVNDIQELKNGTIKYVCDDAHTLMGASRPFNSTLYSYRFNASLELPSGHFVLNAQEED